MFKSVLVTGGCGFIASNFINLMVNKYKESLFINIDCMNYCASHLNIDKDIREATNYKFIKTDINSVDMINYILIIY